MDLHLEDMSQLAIFLLTPDGLLQDKRPLACTRQSISLQIHRILLLLKNIHFTWAEPRRHPLRGTQNISRYLQDGGRHADGLGFPGDPPASKAGRDMPCHDQNGADRRNIWSYGNICKTMENWILIGELVQSSWTHSMAHLPEIGSGNMAEKMIVSPWVDFWHLPGAWEPWEITGSKLNIFCKTMKNKCFSMCFQAAWKCIPQEWPHGDLVICLGYKML